MADSDGLSALGFFLPWRNKVKMSETPKKPANVIVCLCCNSHLQKVYDCIDIFGLLALKENVAEKIQQIGGIDVRSEEFLSTPTPTKICRKCFRKVTGLSKAIEQFRNLCTESRRNQVEHVGKARLKRGRKASSPMGPEQQKRWEQMETVNVPAVTADTPALSTSCRMSLFPPMLVERSSCGDILPQLEESRISAEEEASETSASQILQDAGLRNTEVGNIKFMKQVINSFSN